MTRPVTCWLVKSEPSEYSIDDLARDGETPWTDIRNYQARNFIRDGMRDGDTVLYYHSGGGNTEIVGIARVVGDPVPDPTQFDGKSDYHDPKSSPDDPRWWAVTLRFEEKLPRAVTLQELKENPELGDLSLLKRSRLSVHPITGKELGIIRKMAED